MSFSLLLNSLGLALGASVLAACLGWLVALFAYSMPSTARRALIIAAIANLVLPSFVVLNAWLNAFGAGGAFEGWLPFPLFSPLTAILILALLYWPIPFLLVLSSWQRLTSELFESEPRLRGWSLLRWLLAPAAAPVSAIALAVTFVLALNQFAVPALLQIKVYPVEIWLQYNAGLDPAAALLKSWPIILAPAVLLVWSWRREVPWPRYSQAVAPRLARERLGSWMVVPAAIGAGLALAFALLLPLWQLLASPGTWSELGPAFQAGRTAVVQSGLLSAVTATAVLLAAGCTTRWRVAALLWLTFLIPGVVTGIVLIKLLNRPLTAAFYHSAFVVLLAWGLRTFAPGWAVLRRALQSTDPLLNDVARIEGASAWQRFRWVVWPQTGRMIAATWFLVFTLCLWDTEMLVLIMPPGGETLALRIFNFLHYGHNTQVNALCLLLVTLAVTPLTLAYLVALVSRATSFRRIMGRLAIVPLGLGALPLSGCQPADSSQARLSSAVFSRAEVFGERGAGPGQFQKPRSVAVDTDDHWYAVDLTARVQKFSRDGTYLGYWQMPETDLGKPKGMTCDERGNLVVLEPHYARVNVFTPEGNLVQQWGSKGTNVGQISFPRAVAVAPDGRIYISEYMHQERVQVFTRDHQLVQVIGRAGRAAGEFNRAEGLALDRGGRLYVADSCNHRVQVFDPDGRFLRAIGSPGVGPEQMSYPYDVAVDAEGRLYVCEFGNSRIQVFDPQGQWLETIGSAGSAAGQFNNPWSMAIDSHGNLYVADAMNHRVQKLIHKHPS